MGNPKTQKAKKSWWRTWYGMLGSIVATALFFWSIFEGAYMFSDWMHTNEHSKSSIVEKLNKHDSLLVVIINSDLDKDDKISKLEEYRNYKKQSYAVGFRMVKITDEATGKVRWVKQYRDFDGIWRDVFLDDECSEYIGMDCYFYYGEDGERVYRSQ